MHALFSIAPIYEVWYVQVYVIGSTAKLGQWKVHDGLKLNYAGDSVWQADVVMQKGDFPLKYPFETFPPKQLDVF
jgi:4-alpha-glucanotransferase